MKWWEVAIQILAIICGSIGIWGFIEFLIKRKDEHDEKNKILREILDKLQKQEKDNCRTQMLLLMSDYPDDVRELMTIAQHYFVDLHGNWYTTSLFKSHLAKHGIETPVWFPGVVETNTKRSKK